MTTDLTDHSDPEWVHDWSEPEERQRPSRHSDVWHDDAWRRRWLCGMTDEQLDQMSPIEKGQALPGYVYNSRYEWYGPSARSYTLACEFFGKANVPARHSTHELIMIGDQLIKYIIEGQS